MKNKSRILRVILLGAAAYTALLTVLVLAESRAADSGINSFFLAFWYSVTTLTTVGYGDLYPVTLAGKLIGIVFELMSLGVLAAVIGLLLRLFQGRLLPLIRIRRGAEKVWYLFPALSEEALILAGKLREEDPSALILFPLEGKKEAPDLLRAVFTDLSVPELLKRKKDLRTAHVFCLGSSSFENEKLADPLLSCGCRLYVQSSFEKETIPENVVYYDPCTGCAKLYWKKYPLASLAERIVLIGGGRIGSALLEEALTGNILDPSQSVSYVLLGDWSAFFREHPYLDSIVSLGKEETGRDAVLPYGGPWDQDWNLFMNADRVVFCDDAEDVNADRLNRFSRFCPYSSDGRLYAYLSRDTGRALSFGSADELFTPEFVMQQEISLWARMIHEAYCRTERKKGTETADWNRLSAFLRRSNMASADHLAAKARILLGKEASGADDWKKAVRLYEGLDEAEKDRCRHIEHIRWMRFHVMYNWRFGPVRDNRRRIHPLLTDYADLSPEEKAKDDYGWKLLSFAAEEHAAKERTFQPPKLDKQ